MSPESRTLDLAQARLHALSLPTAFAPPANVHSEPRVAIVLEGRLDERRARGARALSAGDIRVAPAAAPHRLVAGDEGVRCLVVELPAGTPWREAGPRPSARSTTDAALVALAGVLRPLLEKHTAVARVQVLRLGAELAARAARLGRGLDGMGAPTWLSELGAELVRHPGRLTTLAALGRRAGVHPMHAARAFREHYGCSIGEWRRLHRLERACALLAPSGHPAPTPPVPSLADIAAETGFADQAHLTRSVRRVLGVTPGRLRRETR